MKASFLGDHVVVRIARVSESQDGARVVEPFLDERDRRRAERFHFPEDRARFLIGRALLRKIHGDFYSKTSGKIELAYTERGQPYIPQHENSHFSISHTHDLVALALTTRSRVGIDVEYVQPKINLIELAERILSEKDFRAFQSLSEPEKQAAFFRVWTRKEAYLKARGEGISEELEKISVSFARDEVTQVSDEREESVALNWRLHTLPVPAGYAGCLACEAQKQIDLKWVRFQDAGVIEW